MGGPGQATFGGILLWCRFDPTIAISDRDGLSGVLFILLQESEETS